LNRLIASKILAISVGLLCVFLAYEHNKSSTYQIGGKIYGTYWKLVSTNYISDSTKTAIIEELDRIDFIASNYKIQSELSLINASAANTRIKISEDLYTLLSLAEELNQISKGAYDVTLGSMVIQGGFGPDPSNDIYDSKASKRFVISDDLYLEKFNQFLFDLSSIAKGFAVDSIHKLLVDMNKPNFLFDVGGELIVSGSKHGAPWVIGIQNPAEYSNQTIKNILSEDFLAVATSGEYRNYLIDDSGAKTSHTFDPATSNSIKNDVLSVTVTSKKSAMLADAWATLLNVVGSKKGLELAEKHQISVLYIINENNEVRFRKSSYWTH
jgi:thiamine biosynthesis lipoprotein|tara:strand:- start:229 stop:1206 length:978 start_codon:yes stop_codon:yes gene_type:complete